MSASVFWEPVKEGESLYTTAPSSFISSLEAAGISLPGEITQDDIYALKGMAACYGEKDPKKNPYLQLVDAVSAYRRIRIWAVY